jgi:hypothetical protein
MNKLNDFCRFIDENKKLYVNSNTGKGKTLLASLLALFFLETHPNFKIIANYHLNIFDNKTNKSLCEYTPLGLLPFSKLEKGNYLIILDDFKAIKQHLENFGSILAILSRKLNVYVLITLHYYTHLIKENREMFNAEIIPELTSLEYNPNTHQVELTDKSRLRLIYIEPNSLDILRYDVLDNILTFVKGNYQLNNVYVKGKLYDTFEVVKFSNPLKVIQEIVRFSKTKQDVYDNVNLLTKNQSKFHKIVKQVQITKRL